MYIASSKLTGGLGWVLSCDNLFNLHPNQAPLPWNSATEHWKINVKTHEKVIDDGKQNIDQMFKKKLS